MKVFQRQMKFSVMDRDSRRQAVDPSNSSFPINKFVGNEEARRRLSRAVFAALGSTNRCCSDYSFALCGPASTGKTYLAKLFAESLDLPFVSIEPQSVKSVHDIFLEIEKVCREHHKSIALVQNEDGGYILPPMVVFIDEVHNLRKKVVQGLLKATEPSDRTMVTEEGLKVCTSHVCWMIATTDRGDLFDAFDTRFQKVNLRLYSKKEMAKIIKMNNPDWSDDVCLLVAKYNSHVPREALAFARDMRVEHDMSGSVSWEQAAAIVAQDHGIDALGMTNSRVDVLKALGQRPISCTQLQYVVHVKEDELKKFVMPPLLAKTSESEPLVTVSTRGYTITLEGLRELEKRSLPNRGFEAMPQQIRDMYEAQVA